MSAVSRAYEAYADLNLWIKIQSGDTLTIADVPALIPLRFSYIIQNWSTYRPTIFQRLSESPDSSRMLGELDLFDKFVAFSLTQPQAAVSLALNKSLLTRYYTVIDQMYINDLPSSNKEDGIVDLEIKRVGLFNKSSFLKLRTDIVAGRDAIADTIGANDSTYDSIYEREPLPKLLSRSISELLSSFVFQGAIYVIDSILANETSLSSVATIDPFAFARANANNPEVDIASYAAGKLVKINYGENLPALAQRTMGNSDKWIEIAIANGLKPPYVDEIGEKIFLTSNGSGSQLVIGARNQVGELNKEKIYLNQIVILQSNTERSPDQRTVVSIQEVPVSGDLVIQLSGESDLSKYKIADSSYMRIFKKNTINSNFFIVIPSDEPLPPTLNKPEPWFLRSKSQDEKNAGVDLLLNKDGDLEITNFGDLKLSYGVENAIQAVKLILSTAKGGLSRHQDYGIINIVGLPFNQPDQIKNQLSESIARQILSDSRFSRLDYLTVEYLGRDPLSPSGYKVNLGVVLAGGSDAVIPIAFGINTP